MGLKVYNKKRDFKKTEEPEGVEVEVGSNRFVVHEHHASHFHHDFRLEMKDSEGIFVLRSWAVPKGMPEESNIKRLAVAVEDHPVTYIDFSGTIPDGQYGAGTVAIWDSGTYELLEKGEDKLSFILHGKRLTGEYHMIQPAKFEKKNWLIFKV